MSVPFHIFAMVGLLSIVSAIIPQVVAGSLTAILSVILAIKLRDDWKRVSALRALRAEVTENQNVAKEVLPDISEMAYRRSQERNKETMSKSFRPPDVDPVPASFRVTAYNNFRKSRIRSSSQVQKELSDHYRWISSANDVLDQREQLRSSMVPDDEIRRYNLRVLEHERAFLDQAFRLCSEDDYERILERAREPTKHWITDELIEDNQVYLDTIDFEDTKAAIDSELNGHTIMSQIV